VEELLRRQKKQVRPASNAETFQASFDSTTRVSSSTFSKKPGTGSSSDPMAEEEGKLIRSLKSQTLDLPPSCVEFCPAFPSYFLVGTYSLQPENSGASSSEDADANANADEEDGQPSKPKQPQSRNGSIIAFQLIDGDV
jgi:hypothetical protein